MAVIQPDLKTIENLRVQPTPGEWAMLRFMEKHLDDSYEVFFQPYLNGDNPDIIVIRKSSGVLIIEVKDWDLDSYQLNPRKNWELKNISNRIGGPQGVKSPIQQVYEYKENLYNLHIENLLEKRIKNPKFLSIVNCCVYFHKATEDEVFRFVRDGFEQDQPYLKFLSYFDLLGFDSLKDIRFNQLLRSRWLDRQSRLFDDELYESFKRYLKPPMHLIEQGIEITYTSEQRKVIQSQSGSQQKVKGVAGCGKTMALARRAVNCHIRTGGKVLILTFNISLKNYIHDKINEVRENFSWGAFQIIHYHQFIKAHNNNENNAPGLENPEVIEDGSRGKFHSIIIDEVQDYQKDWIQSLRALLAKDGELVVFGDEKQNIYQRALEQRKPYTGIGGQWNILKKSFRSTSQIGSLALLFQKSFFASKYDIDEIEFQQSLFGNSVIEYHNMDAFSEDKIGKLFTDFLSRNGVHDNDSCIQSVRVENLRSLDHFIRKTIGRKTKTMFETQEIFEKLLLDNGLTIQQYHLAQQLKSRRVQNFQGDPENLIKPYDQIKKELDKVRRYKKFNFWMNSGTTKLSTIHSFKGWEIHTLFLIIDKPGNDEKDDFTSDELIYTAITRTRKNLVIINIDHPRYHKFFSEAVPQFQ